MESSWPTEPYLSPCGPLYSWPPFFRVCFFYLVRPRGQMSTSAALKDSWPGARHQGPSTSTLRYVSASNLEGVPMEVLTHSLWWASAFPSEQRRGEHSLCRGWPLCTPRCITQPLRAPPAPRPPAFSHVAWAGWDRAKAFRVTLATFFRLCGITGYSF